MLNAGIIPSEPLIVSAQYY